ARAPPWRRWSRRSGPDLPPPGAPPRPGFAAQDRSPCARSRGSSSRSRQPCELSRLPRTASVAVQCHVASLFDTPNLFERVISLGLRRPRMLPDSGRPPIKQATCQTITPTTVLLPTPAGPTAGAEVFTGTSLGLSNFI